jgi:hypothetical protein
MAAAQNTLLSALISLDGGESSNIEAANVAFFTVLVNDRINCA